MRDNILELWCMLEVCTEKQQMKTFVVKFLVLLKIMEVALCNYFEINIENTCMCIEISYYMAGVCVWCIVEWEFVWMCVLLLNAKNIVL